jgi:hypothetical protein
MLEHSDKVSHNAQDETALLRSQFCDTQLHIIIFIRFTYDGLRGRSTTVGNSE